MSAYENLILIMQELENRERFNKINTFFQDKGPLRRELYAKHLEFFRAGKDYKLRAFRAANRCGKTLAGAFEVTQHLTGRYAPWWDGMFLKFPTNFWICGVNSTLVRTELQTLMLGPIGDFGTGMIPKECIDFDSLTDARKAESPIISVRIKHASGAFSSIQFKSYESGRAAFQSAKVSIWMDEEAPLDIYTEALLRTMNTGVNDNHMLLLTYTPLKGISEAILNFYGDKPVTTEGHVSDGKYSVSCDWDSVPHLSTNDKEILLASIPPWQREARSKGIPSLGSGAIYTIPWSEISVVPFAIPPHWKRFAGLDVGNHTAGIWFAINPDTGTVYAYHEYLRSGELPSVHAAAMSLPGDYIEFAIDGAAHSRSQTDGENLFDIYKDFGLKLVNADKSVEAGIYTVWEKLANGSLKVFNNLKQFEKEYQMYRRDERGRIVKTMDHLCDALRYGVFSVFQDSPRLKPKNKMDHQKPIGQNSAISPQYKPQPILTRK